MIQDSASFRDPSGYVYTQKNTVYRQVNHGYKENYDLLMGSGLYKTLTANRLLIPHTEIKPRSDTRTFYTIIKPHVIPFISYSYEWCFSQLQDAALLTLQIEKIALQHSMTLKDASSFNIQFPEGKPILIDTLSFEKYEEGRPWIGYQQFCEQFLAPLVLAASVDIRILKVLQDFNGGIPLGLASKLLPLKQKLNPSIYMHIVLHAKNQMKYADTALKTAHSGYLNKRGLLGIIDNLEGLVKNCQWNPDRTVWTSYQDFCPSYTPRSFAKKKDVVNKFLLKIKPVSVWDIGANTGDFSRIASENKIRTVSLDSDPTVIERSYLQVKKRNETYILPLWIDLMNPTPAVGWNAKERKSLLMRPHPEMVLALALIHHLAIANNVPLARLALFFAGLCEYLIIEFVPKGDKQTKILLRNREDIFPDYDQFHFEQEFSRYFMISERFPLPESERTLFLLKRKKPGGIKTL